MPRDRKQNMINKGDLQGSQKDLFGSEIHILNAKEVYRIVKCGKCGNTVKSSQAKTHLSYGKMLTICKECLELEDKERKSSRVPGESKLILPLKEAPKVESKIISPPIMRQN